MIRGLLLIAHGSTRMEANREIFELAANVQRAFAPHPNPLPTGERAISWIVQPAFLDCAKPTIGEGFDILVGKGILAISVLPYFLNRGNHVMTDVPLAIDLKKKEHPHIQVKTFTHIGAMSNMENLILSLLSDPQTAGD